MGGSPGGQIFRNNALFDTVRSIPRTQITLFEDGNHFGEPPARCLPDVWPILPARRQPHPINNRPTWRHTPNGRHWQHGRGHPRPHSPVGPARRTGWRRRSRGRWPDRGRRGGSGGVGVAGVRGLLPPPSGIWGESFVIMAIVRFLIW